MPIVDSLYQKLLVGVALDSTEMAALRALGDAEQLGGGFIDDYELFVATGNITSHVNGANTNAGSVVLTLPAAADVSGESFLVKRLDGSVNLLSVTAVADIDGYTTPFFLGHGNDALTFFSDGTEYFVTNYHRNSGGTLSLSAPTTFALTTGYTKFTPWDVSSFSTAGRMNADTTADSISVLDFPGGLAADLYVGNFSLTFEYTQNRFVGVQLFANGGLVGQSFFGTGMGSNKPITVSFEDFLFLTGNGAVEVHIIGEVAGTLDVISTTFSVQRSRG